MALNSITPISNPASDMNCSSDETSRPVPSWHRVILTISCVHSAVWGLFIIAFPRTSAVVYGFETPPEEIFLWQGTGLFISLLAFGYGLAARNPRQHWGIVLIGLLAKVAGAVGMCLAVIRGEVSPGVLWLLPVNDIVWWWPFWRIVISAVEDSSSISAAESETPPE